MGVVVAQRTDEIDLGGDDSVVLEMVHHDRTVLLATAFVGYLVILSVSTDVRAAVATLATK